MSRSSCCAVLSLVGGFVELPPTLGDMPCFTDFLRPALPAVVKSPDGRAAPRRRWRSSPPIAVGARHLRRLGAVPAPAGRCRERWPRHRRWRALQRFWLRRLGLRLALRPSSSSALIVARDASTSTTSSTSSTTALRAGAPTAYRALARPQTGRCAGTRPALAVRRARHRSRLSMLRMILLWLILAPLRRRRARLDRRALAATRCRAGSRWSALMRRSRARARALVQPSGDRRARSHGAWLADARLPWIPQLGIRFHLALDGLSLLLLVLTASSASSRCSPRGHEIHERVGFFHFNLLWMLAGIIGVFLALDLFLFYLLLGADAGPDVLPDRDLGPRAPRLRRDQVLPLHAGQRPADAGRDPGARLRALPRDRHLHVRLLRSCCRHAAVARRRPSG